MTAQYRIKIHILIVVIVFFSACILPRFSIINHSCESCANFTICKTLANPPLSIWYPPILGLVLFFLYVGLLLPFALNQFPENLNFLSLVRWKIQMNN